ncbi:uncharacterized protein LOC136029723 [Artemia franciscana]|uniref:uncharacterized protein LOC136029723 n=1 Tax=Artemia franciscana TaxID=6661 RepID=UPI0032DA1A8B
MKSMGFAFYSLSSCYHNQRNESLVNSYPDYLIDPCPETTHRWTAETFPFHSNGFSSPEATLRVVNFFQQINKDFNEFKKHMSLDMCEDFSLRSLDQLQSHILGLKQFHLTNSLILAIAHLKFLYRDSDIEATSCTDGYPQLKYRLLTFKLSESLTKLLCIETLRTKLEPETKGEIYRHLSSRSILRFHECSPRQMRDCVVATFISKVLNVFQSGIRLESLENE